MNYEKIKSVLLAVLVVTSVFLTWNIWNYQADYETIDNNYIHEIAISENRDAVSLIKPYKIIFHQNNNHYGTTAEVDVDGIIKEMLNWDFPEIRNISGAISEKHFSRLLHGSNRTEVIFPAPVPFETLKGILNIENDTVPNVSFDRIIISEINAKENKAVVYFVSTKERLVFESNITSPELGDFKNKFVNQADRLPEYFAHKLDNSVSLFLPADRVSLVRYKYFPDYIEVEKFKNALFSDPGKVKKGIRATGEEYTDGSSMMRVNHTNNMIFYVNPAQEAELDYRGTSSSLIEKSINFVNEHHGWTDKYRFFDIGTREPKVSYRLFMNGYPVFNKEGMAEVTQYWGKDQIYQYVRPYFTLDITLPSPDSIEIELPSGLEAVTFLYKQENFQPHLLEDMVIGYHLTHDPQSSKILVLEPAWYYKYNGS
ncbi:MAG TPA: two-component system activity regulator YycH, partial [Chondromyces sp.]|nr:two-component system activity regulator YycH [Chondromyces sp.]